MLSHPSCAGYRMPTWPLVGLRRSTSAQPTSSLVRATSSSLPGCSHVCAACVACGAVCHKESVKQCMRGKESHTGPFVCSFANLPVTALVHATSCHPRHSSHCPRTDATRVASESGHAMCNTASQLLAGVCEVIPCKPSTCVCRNELWKDHTHHAHMHARL